jgi:hypothetical protein
MSTFRNSFGIPLQTLRETWPLNNRGLKCPHINLKPPNRSASRKTLTIAVE